MYLLLLTSVLIVGLWTPSGECGSRTGYGSKFVKLKAPKVVDPTKEKTTLECIYDLAGEGLFSVSWFKDGNEFYRYMSPVNPASDPSVDVFDVHGIRVDLSESNDTRIVIQQYYGGKWVNIAGSYGCQVSGEGPKFDIMYDEANVTVGVLYAYADPVLKGIKSHHSIGDTLTVTCTSAPVYPPAQLAFLINGHQIEKSPRIKLKSTKTPLHIEGNTVLSTTSLQLSLKFERHDFNATGSLSLVCQSRLPEITSVKPRETRAIVTLLRVASAEAVSNNEKQLAHQDTVAATNTLSSSSASSLLLSTVTTINPSNIIPVILIFNNYLISNLVTYMFKCIYLT